MITCAQLDVAVAVGTEIYEQLKAEHKKILKGYLVLAHGVQQVELTSDPLAILVNGDQMIVADATKREALRLFAEKKKLESSSAKRHLVEAIVKELDKHLKALRFDPDVQIELRFHDLLFDLVCLLQTHPLIDQDLTPQTPASIRIVLGTIGKLSTKS